jgi:hypothetical protein
MGQISSVQRSTGDAVAAIRAITRHVQDINSHTLKVVGAIEHQEVARRNFAYAPAPPPAVKPLSLPLTTWRSA